MVTACMSATEVGSLNRREFNRDNHRIYIARSWAVLHITFRKDELGVGTEGSVNVVGESGPHARHKRLESTDERLCAMT